MVNIMFLIYSTLRFLWSLGEASARRHSGPHEERKSGIKVGHKDLPQQYNFWERSTTEKSVNKFKFRLINEDTEKGKREENLKRNFV
jgi:hypothetical protein